jgi:hypothetical protein
LYVYTYPENYEESLRRMLIDDTGSMSLGGGGFGGEGLKRPRYGLHLFGGGMRVEAVRPPEEPQLSLVGTDHSAQYIYQIVARDSRGNESEPSPAAVINGPMKLDQDNFVRLNWDQCAGAETYSIIRNGRRLNLQFRGEGTKKEFEDRGFPASPYEPVTRNRTADVTIDGLLTVGQGLQTTGICRAAVIDGDRHNYDPPGFGGHGTCALTASRPVQITGLRAPESEGRWLLLVNAGGNPVTLSHNSEDSDPRNRILTGTSSETLLKPNQTLLLIYLLDRWRVLTVGA